MNQLLMDLVVIKCVQALSMGGPKFTLLSHPIHSSKDAIVDAIVAVSGNQLIKLPAVLLSHLS